MDGFERVGVGADPLRFPLVEATFRDAARHAFLVLAMPVHGVLAPEVELVVERVDPDRGAPVGLLEVDVPAGKVAVLALPLG